MTFILSAREAALRLASRSDLPEDAIADLSPVLMGLAELERDLAEANRMIEARTPWVSPLVQAVCDAVGFFGPTAPAQVRRLKEERDQAMKERDGWREQFYEVAGRCDGAEAERDRLRAENDELRAKQASA